MVMKTTGMLSTPRSSIEPLQRADVHVALERRPLARVTWRRQVDRLCPAVLDIGARGVEVGVVGHDLAVATNDGEQDLLGGTALVGRDHVLERKQLLDRVEKSVPGRRAGIAFVAVLDGCPLVAAHRARPRVGQQVDDHVLGVDVEEVVARRLERRLTLVDALDPDRLDRMDAEGLDDGLPALHAGSILAR